MPAGNGWVTSSPKDKIVTATAASDRTIAVRNISATLLLQLIIQVDRVAIAAHASKLQGWFPGDTRNFGLLLLTVGGVAFVNSLGSGGGYFASALVIAGATFVLTAIVKAIIRVTR